MTTSAALCDTVPPFMACPRYRVRVLHSPVVAERKTAMSENPPGGPPGMNRGGAIPAGAA
jgi:hypothetical protein